MQFATLEGGGGDGGVSSVGKKVFPTYNHI